VISNLPPNYTITYGSDVAAAEFSSIVNGFDDTKNFIDVFPPGAQPTQEVQSSIRNIDNYVTALSNDDINILHEWVVIDPPLSAPEFLGTEFYGVATYVNFNSTYEISSTIQTSTILTDATQRYTRGALVFSGNIELTLPSGTYQHNITMYDFTVSGTGNRTMSDLEAFIPSIAFLSFSGNVNSDDKLRCKFEERSDRIRVWVQNSEQREAPRVNWLAIWR
jgi:hypothetical protein